MTGPSSSREACVQAGALAGIAGLAIFLLIHAAWIVPIWFIAPIGALVAAAGGALVGAAYAELLPHLPRRPWTEIAVGASIGVILLPAVVIAEVRGPVYSIGPTGDGVLLVPGSVVLASFVLGLLATATGAGAVLGWLIGRSRRAAGTMAAAAFLVALGPGHNVPLLGGTSAVAKELVILSAVIAVSSVVLVGGHAWLDSRRLPGG